MLQVASKQWHNDLTKLCIHKRKIIAMATFHNTALQQGQLTASSQTGSVATTADLDQGKIKDFDLKHPVKKGTE